jgi:septal ring factor EnvC (AmiA/AmiB activator)
MTRKRTVSCRVWGVAIVAVLALGVALQGCAHKAKSPQQQAQADYGAYRKRIREVVKDPARADQVIALTDELQRQVDQVRARLAQNRADLAALNANYGATRGEFEALFKQQDADRQALADKAVSARVQAGKLLTDSEWQALHRFGFKVVDANLKELAS